VFLARLPVAALSVAGRGIQRLKFLFVLTHMLVQRKLRVCWGCCQRAGCGGQGQAVALFLARWEEVGAEWNVGAVLVAA